MTRRKNPDGPRRTHGQEAAADEVRCDAEYRTPYGWVRCEKVATHINDVRFSHGRPHAEHRAASGSSFLWWHS